MNFRKICINAALITVSTAIGVTAMDKGLGVLKNHGFSLEQVAHAPDMSERRENLEFDYVFATNSQGLRSEEVASVKESKSRRVLVVGDSFVEGFGVAQNETFTSQLSQQYQNEGIEFINAGLSGQGPLKYEAVVKAFSSRLDADAILLCLFANDLADMALPPGYRWYEKLAVTVWPNLAGLAKTLKHRGNSPSPQKSDRKIDFVDSVVAAASSRGIEDQLIEQWQTGLKPEWVEAADNLHISGPILSFGLLNPQFWSESIDIDTSEAQEKWQLMRNTLIDIATFARENEKELAVVYIPSVFQYDIESFNDSRPWPALGSVLRKEWLDGQSEIQARLSELMQRQNTHFLDLTPALRKQVVQNEGSLNFHLDEHFNSAGHTFTAKTIDNWLQTDKVFSFMK